MSPFTVPSVTVVLEAIRKITRTTPAAANAASSARHWSEQYWQFELPSVRLRPGLHPPHRMPEWLKDIDCLYCWWWSMTSHFHSSQKDSADETKFRSELKCCLYCCGILSMLLEGKGWFDYWCSIQHDGGLTWEHNHIFQKYLIEWRLVDTVGRK